MTKKEVEQLQREMNGFTGEHLENFPPIVVDGDRGHLTNHRVVMCKFYLGYTGKPQRSLRVMPQFHERLEHPNSSKIMPAEMLELGEKRRHEQHEQAHQQAQQRVAGVGSFDGRPIANWLAPYLNFARQNGWTGTLQSGFRTPAHSEEVCIQICGAPSCPGRCAGRTSNHSGKAKPRGAVDVSDFARFGQLMRNCPFEPRILNALPDTDPSHFSATGH
jgi:hypothetical protein